VNQNSPAFAREARINAVAAAALSAVILIGTTQAIRFGGRTMHVAVPWVINVEVIRDCFRVPFVGVLLIAGAIALIAAFRHRSHVSTGFISSGVVSMIYLEGLFRWTAPPPDIFDFRIAMTVTFGYVPQTIAILALITHALIFAKTRHLTAESGSS
jgi:hypothetical protein